MLALAASRAGAGALPSPDLDPASRITITARTPFDDGSAPGACTVALTIRNDGPRDGTWTVALGTMRGFGSTQVTNHSLSVARGQSRTFTLVAVAEIGPAWGTSMLTVSGPGATGAPVAACRRDWGGSSTRGSAPTAPFAMSHGLAGGIWDALEQHAKDASREPWGIRFVPADLPADARSYAGFSFLYLRQDEWDGLPAAVREAIADWVGLGGRLWLLGPEPSEKRVGFGRIATAPLPGGKADWQAISTQVQEAPTYDLAAMGSGWTLHRELPNRGAARGLLLGYIFSFALLVGPVNLFWFARGRFRHRVYWTTPLLAALAALALGAIILLRDGVGGSGARWTAVAIRPDSHRASIVQDQVARTGLLTGNSFRNADPLRIVSVTVPEEASVFPNPFRVAVNGDMHTGWFRSRSLDAHYVETTRPTRGRVEVARGADSLEAVSSLEGVLDELYVRDGDQTLWHARGVRAGERVRLERATTLATWFTGAADGAGPSTARRLAGVMEATDYFYATATGGAVVETLPAIRWTQKRTVYVGPVERLP